ncbi:UNVERIFIED_CONTAM: LPXTG cell wall anchor domain-containing protein [Streptococcus canis]|uniref:LPXTG cell wall anchor domain-containing protein n=3 Tax=Streptococcus canis TaxID=1329 RepID=UPI0024DECC14|nr:LPXTG cell wall anchor domain-containing protein [Streptococcus canis]
MRKNMSLCRRMVATSVLALTLVGVAGAGAKVEADSTKLQTELDDFSSKFGSYENSQHEEFKRKLSSLSDDALSYLMAKVVADYSIDTEFQNIIPPGLNYLGVSNDQKQEKARQLVFAEMRKRIKERDAFRDEVKHQQKENSKLNTEKLTLTEAMITHFKDLQKAKQDLEQKGKELENITKQFRLTVLESKSEKEKLEAERDGIKVQLSDSNKVNAELKAQMENLQAQAEVTAQSLKESQEKVAEATKQNSNLQSQLDKGQNDLATLQKRFEDATKSNSEEKTQLQQELEAKKKEVAGLQSQVTDSTNKLKVLEAAQKAAEVKVAELTEQKAAIETKLQQQSDLSAQDKAKLEQKLADVQAKITDKEKAIKALEEQLAETTKSIKALEEAKAQVEEKLKNQSQLSEQEKAQLQKELQDLMAKLEALKKNQDQAPSVPETPEVKPEDTPKAPETPEVAPEKEQNKPDDKAPGKHSIPWTALTPAQPIPSPKDKATPKPKVPQANTAGTGAFAKSAQLPATGEKTSPFFTAAALAVIVSSGVLAHKRKEN